MSIRDWWHRSMHFLRWLQLHEQTQQILNEVKETRKKLEEVKARLNNLEQKSPDPLAELINNNHKDKEDDK